MTANATSIAWEVVPSIERLAFIGRVAGRAVGVIEWDGYGYRAVTSNGTVLGTFPKVKQAEAALAERVGA